MNAQVKVKDVHDIRTIEELKTLSDPLRLQIIQTLRDGPMTASQAAQKLGQKPTKFYYHFAELEKHGLIHAVETRQKGNLLEKYYLPAARYYRVDRSLFHSGDPAEGLPLFYEGIRRMLDTTAQELKEALDAGRIGEKEIEESLATSRKGRLTPQDARELRQRLGELIDEYGKKARGPEATVPISLTILFQTLKPEGAEEETKPELSAE